MSLEDLQLIDNETIVTSIIERGFLKIFHQHGTSLDNSDQNVEFKFGQNNKLHQIGNPYLQDEITVEKDEANQAHDIFFIVIVLIR